MSFSKGTANQSLGESRAGSEHGKPLLFKRRPGQGKGSILEIVSYWDDRLIDVDLIETEQPAPLKRRFPRNLGKQRVTNTFANFLTIDEDGCRLHRQPDMHILRGHLGTNAVEVTDPVIGLHQHEVLQVRQGTMNFVLAFVHVPSVVLPKISTRESLAGVLLGLTALLLLFTSMLVYLVHRNDVSAGDWEPWLTLPERVEERQPIVIQTPVMERKVPVPPPQMKEIPTTEQRLQPVSEAQPSRSTPTDLNRVAERSDGMRESSPQKAKLQANPQSGPSKAASLPGNPGSQSKPNADVVGSNGETSRGTSGHAGGIDLGKLGRAGRISEQSGNPVVPEFRSAEPASLSGDRGTSNLLGGPRVGPGLIMQGTDQAARSIGAGGGGGVSSSDSLGRGSEGPGRAQVDVPPGVAMTSGGLGAEEVQLSIRAQLNSIRHCYNQLLQRKPGIGGRLKVNFIIGSEGRVTDARVHEDQIGDTGLTSCITSRIMQWDFPRPRGAGSVQVNYPFDFHAR